MPIKSYLAYPVEGKKDELINDLQSFNDCQVVSSENEELLIVLTETQTLEEDLHLKEQLDALKSLKFLSLVSGFNTP